MRLVRITFPRSPPPFINIVRTEQRNNSFLGYVSVVSTSAKKLAYAAQTHELHRDMKQSTSELIKVTEEISAGLSVLGDDFSSEKKEGSLRDNTISPSTRALSVRGRAGTHVLQSDIKKTNSKISLTNNSPNISILPCLDNLAGNLPTFPNHDLDGAEVLAKTMLESRQ